MVVAKSMIDGPDSGPMVHDDNGDFEVEWQYVTLERDRSASRVRALRITAPAN